MGGAYGNFGVLVRAHAYIRALGAEGFRAISDNAVLNANYLLEKLRDVYDVPYNQNGRRCMHEFVISMADIARQYGVTAKDVAKALAEAGFHPPTMYFPLIVHEALMIEPTESETRESLDAFVAELLRIRQEMAENSGPERLRGMPYTTPVRRVDEATAAREPRLVMRAS